MKNSQVVIYQRGNKAVKLTLDEKGGSIWATQSKIAEIFGVTPQSITIHLKNIYSSRELDENQTCKDILQVQDEGGRLVKRTVKTYNIDVIISIGYRVNSAKATDFRIWATDVLKKYILQGAAINQKRLAELNKVLEIVQRSDISEVVGVAMLIKKYTTTLTTLEKYDQNKLDEPKGSVEKWQLTYVEARKYLDQVKKVADFDNGFASEKDNSFAGIIASLYQTFDGRELYGNVEEKAANLLYLVIKDHPFVDGNKRSAAALFVYFLNKNNALKDINNDTLVAATLMIALSQPNEKKQMILLIRNFLK